MAWPKWHEIVGASIERQTAEGCLSQTPASGSARSKFRNGKQMRVLGIVVMQAKVARLNGRRIGEQMRSDPAQRVD